MSDSRRWMRHSVGGMRVARKERSCSVWICEGRSVVSCETEGEGKEGEEAERCAQMRSCQESSKVKYSCAKMWMPCR